MNKNNKMSFPRTLAWMSCLLVAGVPAAWAQLPGAMSSTLSTPRPVPAQSAQIGPSMALTLGKSTLLRLPEPVDRLSVGNPSVADVMTISERELYLLGKDLGATNVIVWSKGGQATVIDVSVTADASILETELRRLLPGEDDLHVRSSADSVVLSGTVSDAVKAAHAVDIAEAWVRRLTRALVLPVSGAGGNAVPSSNMMLTAFNPQQTARVAGPQVINLLRVKAPMQVMLEVKVAEVSRTLLSKLGVSLSGTHTSGNYTYNILSQSAFFNQLLGIASVAKNTGSAAAQLDAQRDDGLVKMLAEPNIMAISGQEASFRAGGKIFIPVARGNDVLGGTTLTLEEKEFGVGVKFKPTVLEGGRIHLQVAPEVSEVQQTGTPFTSTNGQTAILPSFTLRRAETTVQLNDGQSFMIAGLIQNNASESIKAFPGLGELPILGALFRSSEFQNNKSELMFLITPRLVKPLPPDTPLPTDQAVLPGLADFHLNGRMTEPAATTPASASGFQMR
jgi:pilus assembly protein CpaC